MATILQTCSCDQASEDSSVCGCDDCPGYAPLPKMNPFLSCGNQYSAAHGNFQHVISTVVPKNADGTPNPQLSTHQILFEDEHGKEVGAAVQKAKQCILQGAQLLRQALGAKQRTLVHCEWGQNRSGSICCAFAVLYLGWSASAAIRYFREQNLVERHYSGQSPMSNSAFNKLLEEIERDRMQLLSVMGEASPMSPPPQVIAGGPRAESGGIHFFRNAPEMRPQHFQFSVAQ
ncbi:unnamed protein product [Durusdinium trenchii]|uniref:Tyrosine specific protein phosphatases domain-containing protein n=2 Tax=Durusdinium trenchii TaxID=1381693 RepID=A0ABP0JTU3_9DINO